MTVALAASLGMAVPYGAIRPESFRSLIINLRRRCVHNGSVVTAAASGVIEMTGNHQQDRSWRKTRGHRYDPVDET